MNVRKFLQLSQRKLKEAEVSSARLDVLILLEDILQKDRSWILAHQDTELTNYQTNKLNKQILRRAGHEPLAYIRGFTEFYGRNFRVNKHVLEPRPESETMIDLLKTLPLPRRPLIADVGTGSGCLGITSALEIPGAKVDLYDIDSSALAVAKHNAHSHELELKCHKRDLLNRVTITYDVVLANLPYIPSTWQMHKSILLEPRIAFLGGHDGLEVYRRLFGQLSSTKRYPRYVLTEALPPQHPELADIAEKHGYRLIKSKDLIQVFETV